MLFCLPLEPMEERYTEQWYRWFKEDCNKLDVPCMYIDGEQLSSVVEVGTVLDAAGTNYWKATQLACVCKLFKDRNVQDGDVFFTMDMWHPGLEMIPYMATLYGLDVRIYAFLHAGSYTTEDFAAPMWPWAMHFEAGWHYMCDKVFVGSQYHKDKFDKLRLHGGGDPSIVVTGNPIRLNEMPKLNAGSRENIIIFTHRWDVEKRPNHFVEVMSRLWQERQDFKVIITTSRPTFRSNSEELLHILDDVLFPYEVKVGLSKQNYYNELNKAKIFVSTTIEENFGYCLVEAMAMGVTPVVAAGYSHSEIVGNAHQWLYWSECVAMCSEYLDNPVLPQALVSDVVRFEDSFVHMIEAMYNE